MRALSPSQQRQRAVRAGLLVLAVAVLAALLRPAAIEAHAGLVRSEPAAGAVLATPPGEVALWFSEPVVPGLTEVTVLDAGGAGRGRGELAFDSSDRTAVRLAVDELVEGVYTVVWRSVSSVDGHAVSGQFSFAVGEASGALPRAEERAQGSGAAGAAARWLASAPALAAFGLLLMGVLGLPEIDVVGRLQRWALGLLPLALLGAGALLVVQLSGTGGLEGRGDTLTSRWAARTVALGAAFALLFATRRAPALAVLVLALAATSGASHAAASNAAVPATLADLAHRLAAGAWLGGLLGVALSWRAARDRVALVRAFTGVATVVVGGLLAFGVVSALAEVGSWAALRTPYGTVLLLKVGVSAAVLALAAVNRWWLTPRLAGAGERWLLRLVAIEGVLLLALIAGGARLATSSPRGRRQHARAGWFQGPRPRRTCASRSISRPASLVRTTSRCGCGTVAARPLSGRASAPHSGGRVSSRTSWRRTTLGTGCTTSPPRPSTWRGRGPSASRCSVRMASTRARASPSTSA